MWEVILNWMVFITEMKCVSYAVRTETSCTIHVSFRYLTAEAWDRSQARHVRYMVDNVALGQVSSKYFRFPSEYHPAIASYIHYLYGTLTRTKWRNMGTHQKQRSLGNRGALDWHVLPVLSSRQRLVATTLLHVDYRPVSSWTLCFNSSTRWQ